MRNGIRTGVYKLSSLDAYNSFYFNVPQYFQYKDGIPIENTRAKMIAESGNLTESEQRDIKNSAIMKSIVWDKMKGHLIDYAIFHTSKSANFFLASGLKLDYGFFNGLWMIPNSDGMWDPSMSLVNSILDGRFKDVWIWFLYNAIYIPESLFLLLISLCGLYWTIFSKISSSRFFLALIIWLALVSGQLSNPRYRIPVIPLMYLSGVAGVVMILDKYRKKI